MRSIELKNIDEAIFRSNPTYELILFDRLPPAQKEALADLQKDPDYYGILRPREQGSTGIKSVCRNTALLYFSLRDPGGIPSYVQSLFGTQCRQAVAELVLDGVLEIENCGSFISGPEAFELISDQGLSSTVGQATIACLSIEALKYAQALEINDSIQLSQRLYFYNRQPVSAYWKRKLPTPEAVAAYLDIQSGSFCDAVLNRSWSRLSAPEPNYPWLSWVSRHPQSTLREKNVCYKLYVSPSCESARDTFHEAIEVLSKLQVPSFKIGSDVYGLLRPDKFVAYFWELEEMQVAADRIASRLAGCPAHGVPFTAEITHDGLLSWGTDPPEEEQTLNWTGGESWRLWLTNRLATALLQAKTAPSKTIAPWRFALERLRLQGVDTDFWIPAETIWRVESA